MFFFRFVKWEEFHYQLSTRTVWCFNWSSWHTLEISGRFPWSLNHLVAFRRTAANQPVKRQRVMTKRRPKIDSRKYDEQLKKSEAVSFNRIFHPARSGYAQWAVFPRKFSFNEKGWENPVSSHEKTRLRSLNSSRVRDAQSTHPKNRKYSSWRLKCFDIMRRFLLPPSTRFSFSFCASLSLETSGLPSLAKF